MVFLVFFFGLFFSILCSETRRKSSYESGHAKIVEKWKNFGENQNIRPE
jgi:hypothetical protein